MNPVDPFAPTSLFGFPVHSSLVNDAASHKAALVREIQQFRKKSPGVVKSNRGAWHSGDDFMAFESPHVAWVLENVKLFAHHALARYYNNWATQELVLGKYWANVLGPGGWNAPHHHVPNHWSGSYYVDVEHVQGPVQDPSTLSSPRDEMSGMIEFLNPNPIQAVWNRSGNFAVGPKDGMTILFPSALVHFVHPNRGTADRITIAYNFNVVPKQGP